MPVSTAVFERGADPAGAPANGIGFGLLLLFISSWLLHFGFRVPALGTIRFDLLLVLGITVSILASQGGGQAAPKNLTRTSLLVLIVYVIATLPLVEWPGSVLSRGLDEWVRVLVFYFFTVSIVTTQRRLLIFVAVFVGCQSIRVLEPLYLNLTQGYWGSFASMGNYEYMERLAGAPSDVVNPNGLAFVICMVFPFLYFLAPTHWQARIAFLGIAPLLVYALILTGSRSGFIGLLVIAAGILVKSKHRLIVAGGIVAALLLAIAVMSPDQRDRYVSIYSKNTKNSATADGRMNGLREDFAVAMRRPLFGHGLGTSAEANTHYGTDWRISHNLYTEIAQELGFVGLGIFLLFMGSIAVNFVAATRALKARPAPDPFLVGLNDAMQVWLVMNLVFSVASYGLKSYEWYLFGGLSVVVARLAVAPTAAPDRNRKSEIAAAPAGVARVR